MTLSDLSIKRPVFAWMVMIALIIFGFIGFQRMGVSRLPDVEFPVISINMTWQGAAPEVMESNIVDVVEQSVMSIEGIRSVTSSVRQGQASVSIELELGRDPDVAVQEVQTKVLQAQRRLPDDMDPPIVSKVNPTQQPIMWLALSGNRSARELNEYMQDHLQDQFATVKGVGEVSLGGFVAPNLRVWVNTEKLMAYELTVKDVVDAIKAEHVEKPAGIIETDTIEQAVRSLGEASSAEDFGNIVIPKRSGQPIYKPIYLKDVATIEDGLDDVRRISRSDGQSAIGLGIRKQTGSNEVEVGRGILAKLEQVKKRLPKDLRLEVVVNRTKFIEESIHELVFTLFLSALVTSLVCWLFLGSWSATLNVLLAIPTSIMGTFIVTYFFDFTLNTFTILGLSLAVGIVVDDAIMVLENIVRYREKGFDREDAAREGARQITFAALAATLAIVAIFLPVAFMTGIIGKFFYEFGVTISIAVIISLIEALMLTPMRCAQFLHVDQKPNFLERKTKDFFHILSMKYHRTLGVALQYRWLVVLTSLMIFAFSLLFYHVLRKEFVPPQDEGMFLCNVKAPTGSSITYTDSRFKEIEKFVQSRSEVQHYFAAIGGGGGGQVNQGILFITLKPRKERALSQGQLMDLFRKELNKIPDTKVRIQDLSISGFSAQRGFPIEMSIQGPEWEQLWAYANEIEKQLSQNPLFVDVDTDYLTGASEINVVPDRVKAAQYGVSVDDIGETVNALIGGSQVAQYTRHGRRYDVRVRLVPEQRMSAEDITKLWLWNNQGQLVQLKDVVTIAKRDAAINITRRDRERAITIFANVAAGKSLSDATATAKKCADAILPEDYAATFVGSTKTSQESSFSLLFVFFMGIVVAYMVLASQFNSYKHPFTVLMALPFSVSGAFVALWLTNQSLNVYSLIGLILLMGIVKKNSILLVDFTNQLRSQGKSKGEALLEACPLRLRPILMTSLATIAAAIPPALALGPGAEVRIPMSITVIGGVIVSTFFTLFVVPCVYSLLEKK